MTNQKVGELLDQALTFAGVVMLKVWDLLNSAFSTAMFGALAGALGGAYAAQKIAERARRQSELLAEVRHTNSAIMLAFHVCNMALAVKKQHIAPLKDKFDRDLNACLEVHRERTIGSRQGNAPFEFEADLKTFHLPGLSSETLQELVFSKLSTYGKSLSLIPLLQDSANGLRSCVQKREELVEAFKSGAIPKNEFPVRYFGLPSSSGVVHREYADLLVAMVSYCDDVIYFSEALCRELVAHGKGTSEKLSSLTKRSSPKVSEPDFSKVKSSALFPDASNYTSWERWFGPSADKDGAAERDA